LGWTGTTPTVVVTRPAHIQNSITAYGALSGEGVGRRATR
jgi:hypothetical protein